MNSIQIKEVSEVKKVILGLVLASVLSGCAHRAPASKVTKAAEPNLNDTVVQICDFAVYANNESYPGKPVTLIRSPDGKETIKFNNGTVKPVVAQKYDAESGITFHIIQDRTKQGALLLGMAHDCR